MGWGDTVERQQGTTGRSNSAQGAPFCHALCSPQHVALCVKLIAAWYIPDVPQSVKNQILDKKHTDLRKELR